MLERTGTRTRLYSYENDIPKFQLFTLLYVGYSLTIQEHAFRHKNFEARRAHPVQHRETRQISQ
jgi:hypothetical protein